MIEFSRSIIPLIEAKYAHFTRAERTIADYFLQLNGREKNIDSAKHVAKHLTVSEASLTRFAQKCGFRGFREFNYAYQQPDTEDNSDFMQPVLSSYQELLNKTYSIVDMAQTHRITNLLLEKKRVYIYGKGSSGMVAKEIKFRFMRIGLICEAITDNDMMHMNTVLVDETCLVIGISISGRAQIIDALRIAKENHAATVLFTANANTEFVNTFDEVQLFAVKNNLEYGRMISPQFPILIVLDMLYADYIHTDRDKRDTIWQRTYRALQQSKG